MTATQTRETAGSTRTHAATRTAVSRHHIRAVMPLRGRR
jgi:hypothetical protein